MRFALIAAMTIFAYALMADGPAPKPITVEEKLALQEVRATMFEAMVRVKNLEVELEKYRKLVSDSQKKLNDTVESLSKKYAAAGYDLQVDYTWAKLPASPSPTPVAK